MRLQCKLRELRGERTLRDIEAAAEAAGHKVSPGTLSQIERGLQLPTDAQLAALEQAYGADVATWYEPRALLVIQADEAA